jgi:hypothetical protein
LAKREAAQMTMADEARLAEILDYFFATTAKGDDWHVFRRWRWLSTCHSSYICDGTMVLLSID